ncbi:MAG: hypothetical protein LBG28_05690 [Tannerella sp.]|jgi:REP element-mobilizing transposase RayT|nr:hypothetical protein [Tannerella sp.]
MDKFKNKYRISSARAPWWDYGQNAAYFVTICTAHRKYYFGSAAKNGIQLSELGKIAHNYWAEIPKHFPFVILGEFVIMPNHVHGIVIIDKPGNERLNPAGSVVGKTPKLGGLAGLTGSVGSVVETPNLGGLVGLTGSVVVVETPKLGVSTGGDDGVDGGNDGGGGGTLGVIINQYKRYCTIQIRKIHAGFAWQTRFHDRIIRNHNEYKRIENYIINNPSNWKDDKFRQ